jgi:hypothetical protein
MFILLKQGTSGKIEVIGRAQHSDKLKRIALNSSDPKVGSWTTHPDKHETNGHWKIIPTKR